MDFLLFICYFLDFSQKYKKYGQNLGYDNYGLGVFSFFFLYFFKHNILTQLLLESNLSGLSSGTSA